MSEPLTADELKLVETSDEDIRHQCNVFSFDIDRLSERVLGVDRWQAIIQGHLYAEHVVTLVLSENLLQPDEISLTRMSFAQKLDLIVAMGALPNPMLPPVKVLNRIRNKMAHQLEAEITDEDVQNLANAIPKGIRDHMKGAVDLTNLGELVRLLILELDIIRQRNSALRLLTRKAELRLRKVVRESKERLSLRTS